MLDKDHVQKFAHSVFDCGFGGEFVYGVHGGFYGDQSDVIGVLPLGAGIFEGGVAGSVTEVALYGDVDELLFPAGGFVSSTGDHLDNLPRSDRFSAAICGAVRGGSVGQKELAEEEHVFAG